ncbi:MAG: esterase [Flavobacteriaceae bacterium]
MEKQVTYQTTNTYETLNELTEKTENIWMVLHGIGFLSRFFLKYFDALDSDKNYIIAPQAPSKYYLKNEYRHVGASWLTKENTQMEVTNLIAYLNEVLAAEPILENCKLIVFGFSQGVSIATRWLAKTKLEIDHLILYAGGLPDELTANDFDYLAELNTKITVLVGNKDEYLNHARMKSENEKIEKLFKGKARQIIFEGGHEIKKDLLPKILKHEKLS